MDNVQIILNTESTRCLLFVISRGENQNCVSDIFGEMDIYIYIYIRIYIYIYTVVMETYRSEYLGPCDISVFLF